MFKKLNKKGFTLAELLIVVAIIGVLVAISIPIFTNQLEKAKEGVDESNIRSAYAQVSAAALTQDINKPSGMKNISFTFPSTASKAQASSAEWKATITATQAKQSTWQTGSKVNIAGKDVTAGSSWTVTVKADGTTKIDTKNK